MTGAIENVDIVIADADGRIQVVASLPPSMVDIQTPPAGGSVVMGFGTHEGHYVKDGQVLERPANPSQISGLKITGVPNPSTVTIGTEPPTDVQDGEIDLEFAYPGTYLVVIASPWPYLDTQFEVTQP